MFYLLEKFSEYFVFKMKIFSAKGKKIVMYSWKMLLDKLFYLHYDTGLIDVEWSIF